jgi:hypothetical protein
MTLMITFMRPFSFKYKALAGLLVLENINTVVWLLQEASNVDQERVSIFVTPDDANARNL